MDKDISRWILEFFLHQQIGNRLLNKLFTVLPLPNTDSTFQKCMFLRKIQSEIANNSISEKILGAIEQIEELHYRDGVMVPEEMKAAYCAVTVNCTLRFLEDDVTYLKAVKRIWKARVCKMVRAEMSGLVSEELQNWGVEIEAAVWDSSLRRTLLVKSKESDVAEVVRVYVAKAWENLGPSFLEMLADASSDDKVREVLGLCNGGSEDFEPDCPAINENKDKEKEMSPPRRTTAGTLRGARITDNEELEADKSDKYIILQTPEINNMQEALKSSTMELKAVANDPLPNALNVAETGNAPNPSVDNNNNPEKKAKKIGPPERTTAGTFRGVRITDNEELEEADKSDKYKILQTPEINNIQEALKSSTMELKAVVNDPLPNASKVTDTLVSEIAKNKENVNAPNPSVDNNNNPKSKPTQSLMEPNSTARTYNWDDDSIDELSEEGSSSENDKSKLPIPKKRSGSPLNEYKIKNICKRRRKKAWSNLEEDTLRTGVQKYGKGNWKLILNMYKNIFEERTEVDLKDKWRNMIRY